MEDILEQASIPQPNVRDQLSLRAAQHICSKLYTEMEKDCTFAIEAFVCLLDRICKSSVTTAKEVVGWLVTHEDDVRTPEHDMLHLLTHHRGSLMSQ